MSEPIEPPPSMVTGSAITQGDRLAQAGDWPGAVEQWRRALDGPDAAQASHRIRWFLDQVNRGPAEPMVHPVRRRRAYRAFLAAAILSAVGTVVTIVGIGRPASDSLIIATTAWVCFTLAMVLALVFARRLRSASDQQALLSPSDPGVTIAMEAASALGQTRR